MDSRRSVSTVSTWSGPIKMCRQAVRYKIIGRMMFEHLTWWPASLRKGRHKMDPVGPKRMRVLQPCHKKQMEMTTHKPYISTLRHFCVLALPLQHSSRYMVKETALSIASKLHYSNRPVWYHFYCMLSCLFLKKNYMQMNKASVREK